MDSTFADMAVYLVPPANHALYDVCASILGWDCRREVAVERVSLPGISPELLERWVGPAAQYGPHGTVSGWMRIPSEHRPSIVDDLARLSRTFAPIQAADVSTLGSPWSVITPTLWPDFIASMACESRSAVKLW